MNYDIPRTPLTTHDFEPLFEFTELEELWFQPQLAKTLSDTLVLAISEAWPWMRNLRLGDYGLHGSDQCTFDSLLHHAINCPNLESLVLPVVAQFPGPTFDPHTRPGRSIVNHSLCQLWAGRTPIAHYGIRTAVASFLSDVFPNLESSSSFDESWHTIYFTMSDFMNIRKQERTWAELNSR